MEIFTKITVAIIIFVVTSYSAIGQTAEPGSLKAGQKVQVEYFPDSNKWVSATITEVINDGYMYKVKVAPHDDGKEITTNIHYKRVRPAPAASALNNNDKKAAIPNALVYGKYGCTASQYNGGEVTYIPRGSFVISKDGKYTYYGFKTPSKGTFTVDKSGNLLFKGGYFNGGKATKIDRPNKFFLTFPAIPDNRWTCGLVGK